MKGNEKQYNAAVCGTSGVFNFLENFIRTKKQDFIKENENHQLNIADYSLNEGFNKPIYRIKIRMKE